MSAKILIFDIECYTHDFAADKGYMLCIGYKWLGEKDAHVIKPRNLKKWSKNPTADKEQIEEFIELAEQADLVVGWNSKSFDWRFIQTRALKHKLGALPLVPHADLLLTARATTKMRRSLDNIGKFFDLKNQKIPLDINVWMAAGRGDIKALESIIEHCIADVLMTEEAYEIFAPLSRAHPNVAMIEGHPNHCPRCGKNALIRKGTVKALRHYRIAFKCKNCGHWPTSNPIKYGLRGIDK